MKYSLGQPPRGLELNSKESLPFMSLYVSPEFHVAPQDLEGGYFGPMWTHPPEEIAATRAEVEEIRGKSVNFECSQMPLYYTLVGGWLHIGRLFRIEGGYLLYWLRFANIGFVMALIWITYYAAAMVFPDHRSFALSAATLAACLPQDMYYAIENDVLSPIVFGIAFICLVRWRDAPDPGIALGGLTGTMLAATYLTKLGNIPLLIMAAGALAFQSWRSWRDGKLRGAIPGYVACGLCAVAPILLWSLRMKRTFGDFTGSASKMELMTWTRKPFSSWWDHPIFTPGGFRSFISELIASFWRGGLFWHGKLMSLPAMDAFYVGSTLFLLSIATRGIFRLSKPAEKTKRFALGFALLSVVGAAGFLAFLSIQFDFGTCVKPSRAHPFFTSGRLMSGVLVPFFILYVYGLERLLGRARRALLAVFAAIALLVTTSEVIVNRGPFSSAYNFFHLRDGPPPEEIAK